MKRVIIIAAALIAALPMAQATPYLFTSAGGYDMLSPPVTIAAYTDTGSVGSGDASSGVTYDSYGAGVSGANPTGFVTNDSFLVFDFSTPLAKGTTIQIDLDKITEGYIVYGGTTSGTSGLTTIASLTSGGPPANGVADLSITLAASYTYITITATPDCELNVLSIAVPSAATTPEPGTFVLAGMALIGLGVALRQKTRKA